MPGGATKISSVIYTPTPGFNGIEIISYNITDPKGGTDTGTITIDVGTSTPTITVTYPCGGETLYLNSSVNITWNVVSITGPVTISLWQNGVKVGIIAKSITASLGTYSWLVGQYIGGTVQTGINYTIKIKSDNQKIFDFCDTSFIIAPSTLSVLSPNGGESYCIGSSQNITWTALGLSDNIRISLWKDGVEIGVIASSVDPSLGTYSWTAGNYIGGTALGGWGYQIKLKQLNTKILDYSDAAFGLSAATSLTVISPNGGEVLQSGSGHNITWNGCGLSGNLTISIWKDGVKLGVIAKNINLSAGTYAWTIGQYIGGTVPAGTGYVIKLKEENLKFMDYSDTGFTIN